jgi:hypothetical protein
MSYPQSLDGAGGRHSEGRHVYDPADFGWTYDDLAKRFMVWSSRYGIEPGSRQSQANS